MPLYQFRCEECGEIFEEFMKVFIDAERKDQSEYPVCPKCKSEDVIKQISCFNFHLKGGGWAKDGYSKK